MNLKTLFYAACLFTSTYLFATTEQEVVKKHQEIVLGYQTSVYSNVLQESRKLLINLPNSYETNTTKRYPLIVTLDGSTHFQHLSGTVNWLSVNAARMPKAIIVAIENTNRGRDMTASYNKGGADKFIQFIKEELMPFIGKNYRTNGFNILAGHSMAGHLTLNVLQQAPELFGGYIAMAPWLHQDREDQLTELLKAKLTNKAYRNKFVYLSIGDEPRLLPKYQQLVATIEASGPNSLKLFSQISENDNHMSIPSNTINNALQFIFEPTRLEPTSDIAKQGINSIVDYFDKLSNEVYGYEVSPEFAINHLAYHTLREQGVEQALEIFKINNQKFPDSAYTYDSLADAYHRNKNYTLALNTINQAITIGERQKSPDVTWSKRLKARIENAMKAASE